MSLPPTCDRPSQLTGPKIVRREDERNATSVGCRGEGRSAALGGSWRKDSVAVRGLRLGSEIRRRRAGLGYRARKWVGVVGGSWMRTDERSGQYAHTDTHDCHILALGRSLRWPAHWCWIKGCSQLELRHAMQCYAMLCCPVLLQYPDLAVRRSQHSGSVAQCPRYQQPERVSKRALV